MSFVVVRTLALLAFSGVASVSAAPAAPCTVHSCTGAAVAKGCVVSGRHWPPLTFARHRSATAAARHRHAPRQAPCPWSAIIRHYSLDIALVSVYVACPQRDGATDRHMNAANFSDRTGMTQAACFTFCRGFEPPYQFAGLENGNQCFCGTHLPALPSGSAAPWCAAAPNSTAVGVGCNTQKPCHNPHEGEYCCCAGAPPCQHVSASGTCLSPNITCGGTSILELFDISHVSCGTHLLDEPWCDQSKPQAARVAAIIEAMLPEEKVDALGTKTVGSARLGVQMGFKEALHGLRFPCVYDLPGRTEGNGLCPTSFPHAQLLAASFNRSLWADVGDQISTEVRP
jgi:hypothetical protein